MVWWWVGRVDSLLVGCPTRSIRARGKNTQPEFYNVYDFVPPHDTRPAEETSGTCGCSLRMSPAHTPKLLTALCDLSTRIPPRRRAPVADMFDILNVSKEVLVVSRNFVSTSTTENFRRAVDTGTGKQVGAIGEGVHDQRALPIGRRTLAFTYSIAAHFLQAFAS